MFEASNISWQSRRTVLYLFILLALSLLLVAASYTWFSISQQPRISDMGVYVNSESGLELALSYDAPEEEWGQSIDFLDMVSESAPLKPATWSNARQCFLAIEYGFDGRSTGRWKTLSNAANANRTDSDGYYVVGTFYARTGQRCSVSLTEAAEVNDGRDVTGTYVIGTPIWDSEAICHRDGGSGAEYAVRLGFRISYVTGDGSHAPGTTNSFYIYEPNCSSGSEGELEYRPTPSVDGTDTLVSQRYLLRQTQSSWTEANPVQRDVTMKQVGRFLTDTELFVLEPGQIAKIELYVWLEGQDPDCTSLVEEAQITANVQFAADYGQQSGIVEIPK